jgi:hypothetical protein
MAADLHIEDLVLRVPGISPAEARTLAAEVARRLADRLHGTGRHGRLDEVRVDVPAGLRGDELADAIAAAIARSAR